MKSILLAFAVFSRLPVPHVDFREENMRGLMSAFPLVGLVIGLAVMGWEALCGYASFGPLLRGTGFTLLPLLLTGGIHADGFCDTLDALASHGDAEKKQRILRDPHIGSFAALGLGVYLLLFTALATDADFSRARLVCFALAFVLSRALAGLAVLLFPAAPSSSLAGRFQGAAGRRSARPLILLLVCLGLFLPWLGGWAGLAAFLLPVSLCLWLRRVARLQFGGMSGDLAGWLIMLCEVASLAALAIVPQL